MRISDWSSDVCSSDLRALIHRGSGGADSTYGPSSAGPAALNSVFPSQRTPPMAHWYFSSGSNSPRVGPLDDNAAHAHAQQHPEDLCWRDGMAAWKPVGGVLELAPSANVPPPSMPALDRKSTRLNSSH